MTAHDSKCTILQKSLTLASKALLKSHQRPLLKMTISRELHGRCEAYCALTFQVL